jgi:hypothetical protein
VKLSTFVATKLIDTTAHCRARPTSLDTTACENRLQAARRRATFLRNEVATCEAIRFLHSVRPAEIRNSLNNGLIRMMMPGNAAELDARTVSTILIMRGKGPNRKVDPVDRRDNSRTTRLWNLEMLHITGWILRDGQQESPGRWMVRASLLFRMSRLGGQTGEFSCEISSASQGRKGNAVSRS